MEKYAEAGYSEFGSPATWFLAFGLNSEDNPGYGAQVTLYVRDARPQCLIGIEGGPDRTAQCTRPGSPTAWTSWRAGRRSPPPPR